VGSESLLDLLELRSADTLDLTLTYTIAVEDNLGWGRTVVALERFNGAGHACLQICGPFLANFILDDARGPVGCG
jgi:hypothetical protein